MGINIMNNKEHFKQLVREMRSDWRHRAEIVAGFGDDAASQLQEVLCREIGRRRMTDAKYHALQSCEFFYRAVQILKEESEAVFMDKLPELPPYPGAHFWDSEEGMLRLASVLDRLFHILNVGKSIRTKPVAVRLLRWGSVLFVPLRERVGIYLSERRVIGSGTEWTLPAFAAGCPVQVFEHDGIAVGELVFLEYVENPEADLVRFLGGLCGVDDCGDWRKLRELLRIRYGAELSKYEVESSLRSTGISLAERYGVPKRKEVKE